MEMSTMYEYEVRVRGKSLGWALRLMMEVIVERDRLSNGVLLVEVEAEIGVEVRIKQLRVGDAEHTGWVRGEREVAGKSQGMHILQV